MSVLQRQLDEQGASLAVDGLFGPNTHGAVRSYQSGRRLQIDGIAGPRIWNALVTNKAKCVSPPPPPGKPPPSPGVLPTPAFGSSIDGLAAYDPQNTCYDTAQPGVVGFRDIVLGTFPTTGDSGLLRACSVGGRSEHEEGRARDWKVSVGDPADVASVEKVMDWLFATRGGHKWAYARRLGIMYIIFNSRKWGAYKAEEGWRPHPCSGDTDCHRDHVHFSFRWEGARKQTSWWNQ